MPDRRWHTSLARWLFGWLLPERRRRADRRQRGPRLATTDKTLMGLPIIIIDDSVPPGHAEFRSGRRTVDVDIEKKDSK